MEGRRGLMKKKCENPTLYIDNDHLDTKELHRSQKVPSLES